MLFKKKKHTLFSRSYGKFCSKILMALKKKREFGSRISAITFIPDLTLRGMFKF